MTTIIKWSMLCLLGWQAYGTTFVPCEFESDIGPCYWQASKRGNLMGKSFVVFFPDIVVKL